MNKGKKVTQKEFDKAVKKIKEEADKHKRCQNYVVTPTGLVCECEYDDWSEENG